jgi:hypothetical protein
LRTTGQRGLDVGERKRRHAILELRELVGDVRRQEVAPRGEHLPNLTKIGPSASSASAGARREAPTCRARTSARGRAADGAEALVAGQELVEAVLER